MIIKLLKYLVYAELIVAGFGGIIDIWNHNYSKPRLLYDYKFIPLLNEESYYLKKSEDVFLINDLPNKQLQVRLLNLGIKPEEKIAITIQVPGKHIDTKDNSKLPGYEWEFESLTEGNEIKGTQKKIDTSTESIVDIYYSTIATESPGTFDMSLENYRFTQVQDIDNVWIPIYKWAWTSWSLIIANGLLFGFVIVGLLYDKLT